MRAVLVLFGFLAFLAAPAQAQGPRDVLLNVCNNTPVSVATAAAYRTSASEMRTLRAWFQIEPGQCLQGAINGVTGSNVDLHVMSGSFRWPVHGGSQTYCVPASSTFAQATGEPCPTGQEARLFRRLTIESSQYRGVGQVNWSINCTDLDPAEAPHCAAAPRDPQGLAQPLNVLETCNNGTDARRAGVFAMSAAGGFSESAWTTIQPGACEVIYRGFPPAGRVWLVNVRNGEDGLICLAGQAYEIPDASGFTDDDDDCEDQGLTAFRYTEIAFQPRVSRYTAYLQLD